MLVKQSRQGYNGIKLSRTLMVLMIVLLIVFGDQLRARRCDIAWMDRSAPIWNLKL